MSIQSSSIYFLCAGLILLTFSTSINAQAASSNALTSTSAPTSSSDPIPPNANSDFDYATDYKKYIYVLILAFLAILLVSYWTMVRRRQRALRIMGAANQDADGRVGWMPGYRRAQPPLRPEEGLNERGEAPPPYIYGQPPPSAHSQGHSIPMQGFSGKPPDYMVNRHDDVDAEVMRPSPIHAMPHRS